MDSFYDLFILLHLFVLLFGKFYFVLILLLYFSLNFALKKSRFLFVSAVNYSSLKENQNLRSVSAGHT